MAPLIDDDTVPFGMDQQNPNKLPHPYVTMCHIGFRTAALLTYLFCGWFSDSFISSFVTVMLFLSADFWTVKNITGRLMVGLRWWNYIDDDGNSHWVYESKKGLSQNMVNKTESRIFWTTLFGFPVLWGLMIIGALLSFRIKWLLLAAIADTLNGANLYGYLKCKFGKNEDVSGTLSSMTTNFLRQRVMEGAINMMNQPKQAQATPAFGSPTTNVV
uniref:Golgi apparatus membrane protein TVP23 homolog n=1 Tax=Lygus hesperus TaxID=30085 RepID=A0A0K8SXN3_LYGHE